MNKDLDLARQEYINYRLGSKNPPGHYETFVDETGYQSHLWVCVPQYKCCKKIEPGYTMYQHSTSAEHIACKYNVNVADVESAQAAVDMIKRLKELK